MSQANEQTKTAVCADTELVQDSLHTVTFYSFKGGVGRTTAMLNVAILLAKLGNRVAIADFDLEAPGLDTYDGFKPPQPDYPGLLEYVSEYVESNARKVPVVKPIVYESNSCQPCEDPGALFVIRAGRQDREYRRRLSALDWDKLFSHLNGHLFFANMKAELFDEFGCNFLLVDSRTGLTDVGGVCTALLPDAVILLFFPDEQNIRGSRTVAKAIKECSRRQRRPIPRMYCASRVPNIPEKRIEARRMLDEIEAAIEFDEHSDLGLPAGFGDNPLTAYKAYIERWKPTPNWSRTAYVNAAESCGPVLRDEMNRRGSASYGDDNFFGVRAINCLPDRPASGPELAALRGPEDDECKELMDLVNFASFGNLLEKEQLRQIVRGEFDPLWDDEMPPDGLRNVYRVSCEGLQFLSEVYSVPPREVELTVQRKGHDKRTRQVLDERTTRYEALRKLCLQYMKRWYPA
jgi:MinD-like ATPase involved in chromosome partitioning or flagellar assembly